jgi:predicted MPP superfamily phosphohydrolase
MNRRQFLRYGAGAFLASIGVLGYAWRFEPHFVEIVRRSLPIEHLPETLRGNTLVQVSDLHVGPRVDTEYLIDSFRQVGPMNPDIVAITGDLISFRNPEQFALLRRVLKECPHGRLATVATLGNHDYGQAWSEPRVADRVISELRTAGITVLRNEAYDVGGLMVIGTDDLWARRFNPREALRDWQPSEAALVLCHNPDALDRPGWGKYAGWVLSGHTHGGQCKPPFLPPPILPVKNPKYTAGEIGLPDGRRLYINRGLGHLLQVRFNVRPEITLFTLA